MLSRVRLAVLVTSAIAAVASVSASTASAAVPSFADACAGDLNPAACERLDYLAVQADDEGTATSSATLTSWGVWFLCGLTVCLLFAHMWHRVWAFWRD
jgi:hypothetical protein